MKRLKMILLCLGTVMGIMLTSVAVAQPSTKRSIENEINIEEYVNFYKNSIPSVFKVYIDDKPVSTEKVRFRLINPENKVDVQWDMGGEFISYLKYNEHYEFHISVPGYNTKTFKINTQAPHDKWLLKCNVFLYSNQGDEYTGELAYNILSKKFVHYE